MGWKKAKKWAKAATEAVVTAVDAVTEIFKSSDDHKVSNGDYYEGAVQSGSYTHRYYSVNDWNHSICGLYYPYCKHLSTFQFSACYTYVSNFGSRDCVPSYKACNGEEYGRDDDLTYCKIDESTTQNYSAPYTYLYLFSGAPLIKYDIQLYQVKKNKIKIIDLCTKGTKNKISLNLITDSYNLQNFRTDNCFIYYRGGINIFTNSIRNPLLEYITFYDKKYANTYINAANLYTTLLSKRVIKKIINCDKENNRNNIYSSIRAYTLEMCLNVFEKDQYLADNNLTSSLFTNSILSVNYIGSISLSLSYEDTNAAVLKYVCNLLQKLEIKILFLFQLLFKVNPTYFTIDNMDTFYDYAWDIVNSKNKNEYFTSKKINSYFPNIITDTETFDVIMETWLKYINVVTEIKYLYSVSDAPVYLSIEILKQQNINKNIYIDTYLDISQTLQATELLLSSPSYSENSPPSNHTKEVKKRNYTKALDFFGINENQNVNAEALKKRKEIIEQIKQKKLENPDSNNNVITKEEIKEELKLKGVEVVKSSSTGSDCCGCNIENNSNKVNIINYTDTKAYISPNTSASLYYEINFDKYVIKGIKLNGVKLDFNSFDNLSYSIEIKRNKDNIYKLKMYSNNICVTTIVVNGVKSLSNDTCNTIVLDKKTNKLSVFNLIQLEPYSIIVNIVD